MSYFGRNNGERIVTGAHIVVTVVACSGTPVRLGIAASREVPIRQKEVLQRSTGNERNGPGDEYHERPPFPAEFNGS
jgi:sRNA-binding carbon storage regulator CsrA